MEDQADAHQVAVSLANEGFAVLPGFLAPDQIGVLQLESTTLAELAHESAPTGSQWGAEARRSCIFETVPGAACSAAPELRRSAATYAARRGAWPLQAAARAVLLHSQLTRLALQLLGPQAVLFNEQYILKPSLSGAASSFEWHRDGQWCGGDAHPRYLSFWAALDDMTPENGCLVVRPRTHTAADDRPGAEPGTEAAEVALCVSAGDVVVLSSSVLHASGGNCSPHTRRAWMPQFSAAALLAPGTGLPVSLAIPLHPPPAPP
jgi:hypothetical protein